MSRPVYNYALPTDYCHESLDETTQFSSNDLFDLGIAHFLTSPTSPIFGSPDQYLFSVQPVHRGSYEYSTQSRHGSCADPHWIQTRQRSGDSDYHLQSRHLQADSLTPYSWDTNMPLLDIDMKQEQGMPLSRSLSGGGQSTVSRVSNRSDNSKSRDSKNSNSKHRNDPATRILCHHPDCCDPQTGEPIKSFSRKADVVRHTKSAHMPTYTDCPKNKCDRKGSNGFTRSDHLVEHLRGYHQEDIPKRSTFVGSISTVTGVADNSEPSSQHRASAASAKPKLVSNTGRHRHTVDNSGRGKHFWE